MRRPHIQILSGGGLLLGSVLLSYPAQSLPSATWTEDELVKQSIDSAFKRTRPRVLQHGVLRLISGSQAGGDEEGQIGEMRKTLSQSGSDPGASISALPVLFWRLDVTFFSLFFPESPFDCQLLALLVFLGWTSLSVWDVPAAIGLQRFLLLIINHVFLWLFSHQCDANLRLRFEHKWTWCPQEWCKDRVCQCWRERKKEWKKTRDTVSRKGTRGLWAGCSPPPHHSLFHTLLNIRRRRACTEQDRAS